MKIAAFIMAGGKGERLWPRSRIRLPKQFISLTDDRQTLIQHTVGHLGSLVQSEDIYIATNDMYRDLIHAQLSSIPERNIFYEPVGRDTAPCIALTAMRMQKRYGDCLMLVLPSDHMIRYQSLFLQALSDGCEIAEREDLLVTLGITPTYPEPGYGYIHFDIHRRLRNSYAVREFIEKPDFETAQQYVSSEECLWNSGMFIWKTSTILRAFQSLMPKLYATISGLADVLDTPAETAALADAFPTLDTVSIDYGIMEKADNICTIPCSFGWNDVGGWLSLDKIRRHSESGNILDGNVIVVESDHCIVQAQEKLIAAVGVSNLVIVDTPDALLICDKQHANDIKLVLRQLRSDNMEQYL